MRPHKSRGRQTAILSMLHSCKSRKMLHRLYLQIVVKWSFKMNFHSKNNFGNWSEDFFEGNKILKNLACLAGWKKLITTLKMAMKTFRNCKTDKISIDSKTFKLENYLSVKFVESNFQGEKWLLFQMATLYSSLN